MKWKRILKWSALAVLLIHVAWFEVAEGHARGKLVITVE